VSEKPKDDLEGDEEQAGSDAKTTRRQFLQTTVGAVAVLTGCGGVMGGGDDAGRDPSDGGGTTDPDAGPPDGGPPPTPVVPPEATAEVAMFGIGISSGDVTTEAAIVATRYDGSGSLGVTAWEMDGETYVRQFGEFPLTPAEGGFAHHEFTGLAAGRHYRYAFFEMDGDTRTGRSAIGRFRAAIAADSMEPLILGAVSCTSNSRAKTTLERAGERDDLAVLLMLGDTTYNDGSSSLAEYRESWDESLSSPGWIAVRRATSVLATWDDHEVTNDYDPEERDLAIPMQTFFEHLPLRRDVTANNRVWKSMRWGLTVEIFVLDCRTERLPSTRGDSDTYISPSQMEWLKAGLLSSPCTFKIIANSVPISNFPFAFDVTLSDRWEGYPTQRTEILSFIDDNEVNGVLWVSGDFHFASFGNVAPEGSPGAAQREVLAGPGAQTANPAYLILPNEQFQWSSGENNYTTFELLPAERRIVVQWHNADGEVIQSSQVDFA
jgi:alkaline phosphatase D